MSDINYGKLRKGNNVIFARILPKLDYYELLDLRIVSVYEKYCTATDLKTKQTYSFSRKLAEEILFFNRKLAVEYLNKKKSENRG